VRMLVWIALGVAAISLGMSIFASIGLYANFDLLSDEVRGPHPILGTLGATALHVEVLLFLPSIGLGALALLLGSWRAPRMLNCVIALAALFLCSVACSIRGPTIDRVRSSPMHHAAMALTRLAPIIERYADDHEGSLPPVAIWCKALSFYDPNAADYLTYPNAHRELNGLSAFALNANAEDRKLGSLPGDMVLLFQTEPTVNPVGTRELLTSYARSRRGVLVVFGDLHMEGVRPEELENLRWEP